MHVSLLARSPNSSDLQRAGLERAGLEQAGTVLIASVSGRALAQAARRAGYGARVADLFGDDDTRAATEHVARLPGDLRDGVDADRVLSALDGLVG